jgi:pimeloyl-ACP methyl ester carboxylesterase
MTLPGSARRRARRAALAAAALVAAGLILTRDPAMSAEDRYPPTGPLLEIGGTTVHAHVEGEGPAVILIHGASGNTRDFTFDLVGRLSDRFRVIAFDRPGLGHTGRLPGWAETPAGQAALLDAAAAELGVERAVLVGHSYGGAVALAWALDLPDRAAAVVSLAGAAHPWEGDLGLWYRVTSSRLGGVTVVPLVAALAPRALAERSVASIFEPQPVPAGYVEHVGVDLTLRAETLRANARQVNSLKPHVRAMAARYPGLAIPIEIVHGTEDTIVPLETHSRPLARLAPNARLTVLPGVGHMPHHADPDAAVAAIERAAERAGLR